MTMPKGWKAPEEEREKILRIEYEWNIKQGLTPEQARAEVAALRREMTTWTPTSRGRRGGDDKKMIGKLIVAIVVIIVLALVFWVAVFQPVLVQIPYYESHGCRPLTATAGGIPSSWECPAGTPKAPEF